MRRGDIGPSIAHRPANAPRSVEARAREALAAGARIGLVTATPDTIAFYRLLGFALRPWPRDRSYYLPLPHG